MNQASIKAMCKTVKDNESNIQIYLSEIKQKTSQKNYDEFISTLDNIENVIQIGNVDPSLKNMVLNIIKGFMIQQKRIEVGDDVALEVIQIAEKYKQDLHILKNYVSNLTEIMENNKIEVTDIKPICLETSVSSPSSIDKRLELLRLCAEKECDINDYIKTVNKGKSAKISNDLLKKAAKENNINIRISKNEVNRIIKN